MNAHKSIILMFLLLCLPITTAYASDRCPGTVITVPQTGITGTTTGMTDDYAPICVTVPSQAPDFVYQFTTTQAMDIVIYCEGMGWDTVIFLRTNCTGAMSTIACNDDAVPGIWGPSQIAIADLQPGTYFLFIDGFTAMDYGDFILDITHFPTPTPTPTATNTPIGADTWTPSPTDTGTPAPTSTPTPLTNDTCPGKRISIPAIEQGDTTMARDDYHSRCAGGSYGADVVYEFTTRSTMNLAVRIDGSFDTTVHMRLICDDPSSEIHCNDDGTAGSGSSELDIPNLRAGTYYIIVDGKAAGDNGTFTMFVYPYDQLDVLRSFKVPLSDQYGSAGLAHDGQHLWLMDQTSGSGTITKVSEQGTIVDSFDSGIDQAWGLAWDGQNLWESDITTMTNYEISTGGTLTGRSFSVASWTTTFPADMAFDGQHLWQVLVDGVGDEDIYQFDFSGNVISAFDGPSGTTERGIAFDPTDRTLYFGGWHSDVIFHTDLRGNLLTVYWGAPLDEGIAGMAVDPNSHSLWVAMNDPDNTVYELDIGYYTDTPTPTATNTPVGADTFTPSPMPTDTPTATGTATPLGNDTCPGMPISVPARVTGSTLQAAHDYTNSCTSGSQSPDVVFELTVPSTMNLSFRLTGDFDTALHIRSACNQVNSEIACNDDGPGGVGTSAIDILNVPAGTYYVIVDGFEFFVEDSGNFELSVFAFDSLNEITSFDAPLGGTNAAGGLAHDGSHLWVLDQKSGTSGLVTKLDTRGTVVDSFDPALGQPWGLGYDGTNLWVSDATTLSNYQYATNGLPTGRNFAVDPYLTVFPADLAFDGQYLWQVMVDGVGAEDIYQFDLNGTMISAFDGPSGISERGIAYDAYDDTLYIGGWNSMAIYHTDMQGNLLDVYLGPPLDEGIAGMAIDPTTHSLWVAMNNANNTIYQFDIGYVTPTQTPTATPTATGADTWTPTSSPTNTSTATPTATPLGNDVCPGTTITLPAVIHGSTEPAANDYTASCAGNAGSRDVVYKFTLNRTRNVMIRAQGDYDMAIHVRTMCSARNSEIACNDDGDGGIYTSDIDLPKLPPGSYYIIVDGYSTTSYGDFTLKVFTYGSLEVVDQIYAKLQGPYGCAGMTHDGSNLWVMDQNVAGSLITKLDDQGNALDSIDTNVGFAWGLAWDGTHFWESDIDSVANYQIATDSTMTGSSFSVESYATDWPAGLEWDGQYLWQVMVDGEDEDDIYQFDTAGNVIKSFDGPSNLPERGIAYDASDDTLWFGGKFSEMLFHTDLNGSLIGAFKGAPLDQGIVGMAIDPVTNYLWVAMNHPDNPIYALDIHPVYTPTPVPTDTPTPRDTDTPTPVPTSTDTYTQAPTLTPTETPEPTDTPEPTFTQTPRPTFTPTATVCPAKPMVMLGGYWDTAITMAQGGTLNMQFYCLADRSCPYELETVEIYYQGAPIGVTLYDDGTSGDIQAGDGLWGFSFRWPSGTPPDKFLLEIVAVDEGGNVSTMWPYLTSE